MVKTDEVTVSRARLFCQPQCQRIVFFHELETVTLTIREPELHARGAAATASEKDKQVEASPD